MNERYLFRGKRIDGFKKTWVTGHYVSAPRPMIVATKTRIGGGWDADDIDPDTLGQCTGLRDHNGVLIHEGDVVKIHDWEGYAKVYWNGGSWMCFYSGNGDDEWLETNSHAAKIIGNIHDNPELLHQQP